MREKKEADMRGKEGAGVCEKKEADMRGKEGAGVCEKKGADMRGKEGAGMSEEEARREIAAVIRELLEGATWEELTFILSFLRH